MGKRSGVLCDRQHPPWVTNIVANRIAPASPTRLTDSGSRVSVAWPVLQELGEPDHQQPAPRTGADVLTLVVERGSTGLRPEGHSSLHVRDRIIICTIYSAMPSNIA